MAAVTWSQIDTTSMLSIIAQGVAASGTATDAPSGATAGLSLGNCAAYKITLSADSGQTLNGTGNLRCWVYSEPLGRWTRCPSADISYSSITGVRDATILSGNSPAIGEPGIGRSGRVVYNPDTCVVSSGGITVTLEGIPGGRM